MQSPTACEQKGKELIAPWIIVLWVCPTVNSELPTARPFHHFWVSDEISVSLSLLFSYNLLVCTDIFIFLQRKIDLAIRLQNVKKFLQTKKWV